MDWTGFSPARAFVLKIVWHVGNDRAAFFFFLTVKREMSVSQFGTDFDQSELKSSLSVSVLQELVGPLPSMWKWSLIVHVLMQRKKPFFIIYAAL